MQGFFPPLVNARRMTFPSMATVSPPTSIRRVSQPRTQSLNRFGSMNLKTYLNVSWLGVPFAKGRIYLSHGRRSLPNSWKS